MMFIINFHGIGEAKRPYEDGELPYWIGADSFTDILDMAESMHETIGISFDDGNDSDFLIAVPELRKRKLKADFFVLAGKIGQPGYLSDEQVAAIDQDTLFSVGSHGMDHQPWPEQDDAALMREIKQSRDILSQKCGRSIEIAGLPFGRYDKRVLKVLKQAGYNKIYSSDGGPRIQNSMPIPRYSIRKDTNIDMLSDTITRNIGILMKLKQEIKCEIKKILR